MKCWVKKKKKKKKKKACLSSGVELPSLTAGFNKNESNNTVPEQPTIQIVAKKNISKQT